VARRKKGLDSEYPSNGPEPGGMIDAEALKRYVERAAAVMGEQKELADTLKEICAEADEAGVCTKREIRRLARETLMEQDVLHAQLERMDMLRHALGSFIATPLGHAAAARTQKATEGAI